ncbi:MAG: penicillin-binding protein, partial [Actinobacteria bacterium]|nr:penicillin-binding protein [Actinomycetota bacterium]
MNKQLKFLSRTVFGMFLVLFFAVTMIQFVNADELRVNEYNTRTLKNSYKIERGSILVEGTPVAFSVPSKDEYRFAREYDPGRLYAPITGYFTRQQGTTGLEAAMNEELSGTAGSQFFARIQRIVSGNDPQGSSVETTISAAAQKAAAKAMKGYDGAVVAIEPKTGRILALYSTPGFDPNKLASNDDAEVIKNYRKLDADPRRPLVNRAIAGDLYHPGSTFKLITAAAALETGKYTPKSTFKNPAALTLPQSTHQMRNWTLTACGSGSKVTLQQAIVESCNIPMAEMAMELDRDALPKMAKAFGFEQDLKIPLPVTPSQAPLPVDQ